MLWRIFCDHCGHEVVELQEQGVEAIGVDHGWYIYIYIYISVCVYIYVFVYIYVYILG
jgi:hypothetical protein